ncbi:IF-2B-domain-containing protein [Delitschia confertaspora ATCC 74209]|uniref:Translation initiation factor eIF2B subunit delta n=1 Tax=Delitschia confertaspora ATCC 74209 TaxID=1513339 RepID=A0A9P4JEX4_9PLEO|nr:IF-2B-domain-containing protein [Delitschia confertaspora ATCC 74209]
MSDTPNGGAVQAPALAATNESTNRTPQAPSRDQNVTAAIPEESSKLSPAELKKRAKAEKQARRAQAKSAGPSSNQEKAHPPKEGKQQKDQKAAKDPKQGAKDDKSKALPVRRRPSQPNPPAPKEIKKETKKEQKPATGIFFGHLYNQPRQHSVVGASKEVHPAVLALGLQYSSYIVCGSTARMVSMLLVFKAVIQSYQTPQGTSLARHLTSHHLSPQIDYLRSCRPLSISQGNAIRWLKDIIIKIDPSTPEFDAKRELLEEIDNFILHRITVADKLIADNAAEKIKPQDVILTYASSSIVEKTLLQAHEKGIPFSVIVVDSKPLFEGKRLAQTLAKHGIPVKYSLVSGIAHAVKDVSKVFLGAHAMLSNGRLYSRVGTALVSMLAFSRDIPVIVLCESVKFTERVALDSIVGNELAPAEEILSQTERAALLPLKAHIPCRPNADSKDGEEAEAGTGEVISWFKDVENLQMLQVLYDVTPAEYIKMVITEYGSLPPSSVPVVHRMSTNI